MTPALAVEPGPTTSLQDGGRVGAARYGVPRSGPVDALAHRLAVRLGGAEAEAVAATVTLEVGPHPCGVRPVGGPLDLAVAGDGAALDVAGVHIDAPAVVRLAPEEQATVRARTWAYVAVAGELDIAPVLGSRSQHPRSALGPSIVPDAPVPVRGARAVPRGCWTAPALPAGPLLLLPAPQTERFTAAASDTLVTAPFRTTSAVDRMGQRLDGPPLVAAGGHDIVSDGIVAGALQVPGDGRPFVLTADHQTTGGYPKIAVLTPVDLVRLVRLPPGEVVHFAWTDAATARERLRAAFAAVDRAVATPPRPHARSLAGRNLIGGVAHPGEDQTG